MSFSFRSGRVPGIEPRHPPTPPYVRFSGYGGWSSGSRNRATALSFRKPAEPSSIRGSPTPAGGGSTAEAGPCVARDHRSCDARHLRIPTARSVPVLPYALCRSFGPSLRQHYTAFFATTASADFSSPLREEISPGKVLILSPRAGRLYLTCLGGLRASLFPASSPPTPGLSAASCSSGRGFACRFFQLRLAAYALRFGYGCQPPAP